MICIFCIVALMLMFTAYWGHLSFWLAVLTAGFGVLLGLLMERLMANAQR
jgi:hypothetical protein